MKLPRANQSIDEEAQRFSPLVGAVAELHTRVRQSDVYVQYHPGSIYLERGRELFRAKDFAGAECNLILAGDRYAGWGLHLRCAEAIHELGEVYDAQEMLDCAELCFATAKWIWTVRHDRSHTARATRRLGVISRCRGKLSKAEELLVEALQTWDDYDRIDTLYELGSLHLQQDLCVEAETRFSEALKICGWVGDGRNAEVLQKLGNHYLEQRQYSKAEELSTRALSVWISLSRDSERALTHRQLGDIYRDRSRYTEAEDHYTQAFTIYNEKGALDRAIMLDRLGGLYLNQGRYTEAEEHCTQALELWTWLGKDSDQYRAGALRKLGDLCRTQARYSEARDHFTRAIGMLTSEKARPSRAGMLRELADLNQIQSRYSDAADHLTEALSIYTSLRDESSRAMTLHRLGNLYWRQGRHFKAEKYFTEARAAYASLGDKFSHAQVLCQLSNLYQVQDYHLEAEKHFAEAMTLLTSVGAESDNAEMLRKVGQLLQQHNQYSKAEELFTKALQVSARAKDDSSRAKSLRKLGELYQRQARYSSAEECVTTALQIYTSLGDHLGQRKTQSSLAEVRRLQCRLLDAEAAFQAVAAFYDQIGHPLGDASIKCRLGDTYRQQGKHGEAFSCIEKLKTSLRNATISQDSLMHSLGWVMYSVSKVDIPERDHASLKQGAYILALETKSVLQGRPVGWEIFTASRANIPKPMSHTSRLEARTSGLAPKTIHLDLPALFAGWGTSIVSKVDTPKRSPASKKQRASTRELGTHLASLKHFAGWETSTVPKAITSKPRSHTRKPIPSIASLIIPSASCRDAEAESLFSEARKLCSEEEHGLGAANAALGLVTVHLARMECDTAASDVRKALDFYTEADVLPSKARALLILAQIRGLEHHDAESMAYIDEASAIFSEIGDEKGVSLCREHRLHLAHPNVVTPTLAPTEEQHVSTVRVPRLRGSPTEKQHVSTVMEAPRRGSPTEKQHVSTVREPPRRGSPTSECIIS
ncbi:hypothetical protein FRC05_008156 [Tulasnella sp. 425]|nr:hypothetical protein FRC05_008156 [Tulasnella sp. 425]